MITSLIYFLITVLIILVVLYVFNIVLARCGLPADIVQVAKIIVGLVALVAVLIAALYVFGLAPSPFGSRL